MLEQLSEECADKINVVKVNIAENPEMAARFGITSSPSVYLFKDGKRKITVIGARPKQFIEKEFAAYLR